MTTDEINKEIQLAVKAGLVEAGKDAEGDQQYIGTDKQWTEFERMKEEYDYKPLAGHIEDHDCHLSPEDGCECGQHKNYD